MQCYLSALLLSLLLVTTGFTQSLNPVFKHINRSSGLPADEVLSIAQDSAGFMWLGTKEGLYRYDGFTYKSFFHIPGDLYTIPGNTISRIYVDSKGLLWIVAERGGIAIMNSDGRVLQVLNSATHPSFGAKLNYPVDIKEDKKGNFWCTALDGLFKLKREADTITMVQQINLSLYHYSAVNLGRFVIDKEGKLWLSTWKGIIIYDPAKAVLYHAANNPDQYSFLNDTAFAIATIFIEEERGKIWYSTWEPANRVINLQSKTNTVIYATENYAVRDYGEVVNTFFQDSKKHIWMGTGNGVNVFSNDNRTRYVHRKDDKYSISRYAVNDIFEDREGNFWFATNSGISTTQPYHQPFTNVFFNTNFKDSLKDHSITCIVPIDHNTLLVGTNYGIFETDTGFNIKKHYTYGSIEYDWIWTYYKDTVHQQVYFSTQGGMILYDLKTHSTKKLTYPPFNDHRSVSSFAAADRGNIWMCHYRNDFFKYNPSDKTYKKYSLTELGEMPQILHFTQNKTAGLWLLADNAGLLHFDEKKEAIVDRFMVEPVKQKGLLQSNIRVVLDLEDELFVGYVSKGLSLYNKTSKTWLHFSQADGLISNNVNDAMATKDGAIWITTSNGISRFDRKHHTFINYGYGNGIIENNLWELNRLPDGRLAAGNIKGAVVFNPDSVIHISNNVPAPIISNISVYGKIISADSLLSSHLPQHISYRENYFSIDYISLRYANNQQIEYAYKLEGLNTDWIPAGKRRSVTFANLGGGTYHYKVKAKMPGGNWSPSSFPLPIIVSAAFYTQWWFFALLALLISAVVYAVYRYRIHQLMQLQRMRTQIASDLHDDIGSTLTSISYYSEMVKLQIGAEETAVHSVLDKIGSNARNMVSAMSDIVWVINPANDETTSLVAKMKKHAGEMMEGRPIQYTFTIKGEEEGGKLNLQQRKNIYLIFKEALNNSIKYAACSHIAIDIAQSSRNLSLHMKDDGKGFDLLTATAGNGLANMQKRAAEIGAGFCIDTAPGNGTTVKLIVKIT